MSPAKKDLPASIHQRLLNLARSGNRPLNELLQYFTIERFLFRLGKTGYREMFILKGAQMELSEVADKIKRALLPLLANDD